MRKIYLLAFALIGAISNVFTAQAQAEEVALNLSDSYKFLSGSFGNQDVCGNRGGNGGWFLPLANGVLSVFANDNFVSETSLVFGNAQGKNDTGANTDFTKISADAFSFYGRQGWSGEFVGQTYVLENNIKSVNVSFNISGDVSNTSFSIWGISGGSATMLKSSERSWTAGPQNIIAENVSLSAGDRLVLIWAASSRYQKVTVESFSASYTKAEPKSYNLSIGNTGWATIYLDFNATIPSGVNVYGVTANAEGTKAQLTEVSDVIAANKGYLVKGEATSYTFVQSNAEASTVGTDMLGSVTDSYVPGPAYVLSEGASGVGFYKALLNKNETGGTGESHFKNNANKAYLPAPAPGGARVLTFNFDDNAETGINAVEIEEAAPANAAIYDLSGRRVQSAKSGLYIINGKKVIK